MEKKNAIVEMIKEGLRIALFAGVIGLIGWLSEMVAGLDPNSTYYIVGTIVLRLIDKWVHEAQNDYKGIAWF